MKVYFRVDASAEIGVGHLVRCLALADAIALQGVDCIFILCKRTVQAQSLLGAKTYQVIWIDPIGPYTFEQDAKTCLNVLERDDCMVVDQYDLDIRWERIVKNSVRRLMVIDDLANRAHDCDCLVDPGYGRSKLDYAGLVPDWAELYLGTEFAMLKPEFSDFHAKAPRWPALRRAHVFLGGGAASQWLAWCVDAVLQADPTLHVNAIGQADAPDMELLAKNYGGRLKWRSHLLDMASEYSQCDVAIGSPGTATWERACIGLPSAVIATAKNQIPILQQLDQLGFCRYFGAICEMEKDTMVEKVRNFLGDTGSLQRLRDTGLNSVDGQGIGRIAKRFLYEST